MSPLKYNTLKFCQFASGFHFKEKAIKPKSPHSLSFIFLLHIRKEFSFEEINMHIFTNNPLASKASLLSKLELKFLFFHLYKTSIRSKGCLCF